MGLWRCDRRGCCGGCDLRAWMGGICPREPWNVAVEHECQNPVSLPPSPKHPPQQRITVQQIEVMGDGCDAPVDSNPISTNCRRTLERIVADVDRDQVVAHKTGCGRTDFLEVHQRTCSHTRGCPPTRSRLARQSVDRQFDCDNRPVLTETGQVARSIHDSSDENGVVCW